MQGMDGPSFSSTIEIASLRTVLDAVDRTGIDYWLAGGWAVDFHVGKITRQHSDVDVVVHLADGQRLHEALTSEEYVVADDSNPDSEMIYTRGELKLDLSFIVDRGNRIVSPGWEHWPWPRDSFLSEPLQLQGVSCRVISASNLLAGNGTTRQSLASLHDGVTWPTSSRSRHW